MRVLIGAATLLASSMALGDVALRIGDDSLALHLDGGMGAEASTQLGLVHNDDTDSTLVTGGLFVNGKRDGISGRVGGKAFYADWDDSGYGVALGGELAVPFNSDFSMVAGLYYSPDMLSFSDADGYEEWFVKFNFHIFENALLSAGYSSVEIDVDGRRDVELEDGLFLGMSLRF
ncbi:YfaZ family outer membrane protein [Pseudomaricurvus sp. HS19]|uniref:YfaZ family outer membrane protein n=1 Tax=Pseudomaricurvus sp. HS19 TaxID=2692626 RepID=UPI00136EE8C4|nr:YfaZ family outer membrane protein [Pseudomaricurvus sp. HS19]MYM64052.1 hypothetical protein [Pseudomaricurvus sp. HS19]